MQNSKTAIVVGATGLIGSYLIRALAENPHYSRIKILTRKPTGFSHPKIEEQLTGFQNRGELANLIKGDEVFCCLGTTIKKAGSQDAFRKVDFELPVLIGKIATENKILKMLVVSSLGADAGSSNFYLRTKGEMEKALADMNFPSLKIFRPSMLLGPRAESRPGEAIGKVVMQAFSWMFIGGLRKYKAIHAKNVALAMIKVANSNDSTSIFESDAIESMTK